MVDIAAVVGVLNDGGTVFFHCDAGQVKKIRTLSIESGANLNELLERVMRKHPTLKGNVKVKTSPEGLTAEVESFV